MRSYGSTSQKVVCENRCKENELDAELNHGRDHYRQRHDESRKIDFAEYAGVRDEGIGSLRQTSGEVIPECHSGEIKEQGREIISWNSGDAREDDHEHQGGDQRLDEEPQRAENCLLVNRDKITADEHPEQVAVSPDILQMQVKQAVMGSDDERPII